MYQVITRKSDDAVLDCRPETAGIQEVLVNQVITNHGGSVEDYEISTSETQVEETDLRTSAEIEAVKWAEIRVERNRRLSLCDWTGAADTKLTGQDKQDWWDYRQALRDLPQTYATPDEVIWPDPPE